MQDAAFPERKLTVDDFLDWSQRQPPGSGRFELWHGRVREKHGGPGSMNAEQAGHRRMKSRLFMALLQAVETAEIEAQVEPDGATVKLDSGRSLEPDALMYLGPPVSDDALTISNPIIVCEVLSPATRQFDLNEKRDAYFELPSVAHYLVGDPERRELLHYRRATTGGIEMHIAMTDSTLLRLDPPDISVDLTRTLTGR